MVKKLDKTELAEIIAKIRAKDLQLSKTDKSIYLHIILLSRNINGEMVCSLSQSEISHYTGCSINSISASVLRLKELKFLKNLGKSQIQKFYIININQSFFEA